MQNKIKILILVAVLIVGGLVHTASAITLNSIETVTSDTSIVASVTGFASFDGNICTTEVSPGITNCPTATNYYTETTYLDGVSQGTRDIACVGTNSSILECTHFVEKTTSQTCTYTTSVTKWGECNTSGVQYATAYAYDTIPGSTCTDQAPVSQPCFSDEVIIAVCPYSASTPESPVINVNGGLNRTSPSIRGLYRGTSEFYVDKTISAGTYLVETISWDGYPTRATVTAQPNEQWNLTFYNGSTLLKEIGPTTDIMDLVLQDTRTNTFGPIELTQNATKIRFFHYGFPTVGGSVIPVCIKLVKQDTAATPDPTLTFNAEPGTIANGESTTLTWTTTNADTCTATGGWSGPKLKTGDSEDVSPTEYTEYYLECWNNEGVSSGKRTATVFVTGGTPSEPVTACSLSGGTLVTVNPDGKTKAEIVSIPGHLSDTYRSFEKTLGTPIPLGTYTIDTQSWEGELGRETEVQANELFYVEFYDSANTKLAEVGPTTELLDLRVEDTQVNSFSSVNFTSNVTKLKFLKKDAGGTVGFTGSVIPVCLKFTDEGAPTTLTVGLTQSPADYEISLGTPIKWTAKAINGTGPYTFVWSGGTVSGNGTPLPSDPNNSNYVAPTITSSGIKTIKVKVTDSSTPVAQTAEAEMQVKIGNNIKPQ